MSKFYEEVTVKNALAYMALFMKGDEEPTCGEIQGLMEKMQPAADVVEVVRCKDCYYWTKVDDEPKGVCVCDKRTKLLAVLMDLAPQTEENDYCSWGERKEEQG